VYVYEYEVGARELIVDVSIWKLRN